MAKLIVKENVEVIEFNGKTYEKFEGEAKKGDILRVEEPNLDVTVGDYYEVVDGFDGPTIIDDMGDANDLTFGDGHTLFRAVSKSADNFKSGDKVRLLDGGATYPLVGFSDGETYKVIDNNYDHPEGRRIQIVEDSGWAGYAKPEQLEKVTEDELTVGDYAEITRGFNTFSFEGDIVKLVEQSDDYGGFFVERLNGSYGGFKYKANLRKVDKPEEKVKVGDIVKFIEDAHEHKAGEIVEVVSDDGRKILPLKLRSLDGQFRGYANVKSVALATPEEIEQAKQSQARLSVGDYAKIVDKKNGHGFNDGEIVRITKVRSVGYWAESLRTSDIWVIEDNEIEPLEVEKRHAKKGETMLIVNARPSYSQTHENGDLLIVTEENAVAAGDVNVSEQPGFIDLIEYVVVTSEEIVAQTTPEIEQGDVVQAKTFEGKFIGIVEDVGSQAYGVNPTNGGFSEGYKGVYLNKGDEITLIAKKTDRHDL